MLAKGGIRVARTSTLYLTTPHDVAETHQNARPKARRAHRTEQRERGEEEGERGTASATDEAASTTTDGLDPVDPDGARGAQPFAVSSNPTNAAAAAAADGEMVSGPEQEDTRERLKHAHLENEAHSPPTWYSAQETSSNFIIPFSTAVPFRGQ